MSTHTDRFARARQALAIADALPGRKLGKVQRGVLQALVEHGRYPSGWVWGTPLETVKVLDTLVKRGLVETVEYPLRDFYGKPTTEGHPYHGRTTTSYRPAAFLTETAAAE